MYGAATLEPFVGEDLASQDREVARNVGALQRILGSLLVVADARGDGIGARSWTQQASLSCRTRAATWKDSSMTGTAASGSTAAPAPTSEATTNRCRPGRRSISRPRTTPERTGTGSRSMAGRTTPSCSSAADAARLPTSIPRPTGCRTALGVRGPGRPRLTGLRREPRGRWCARPRPAGCDAAGSSSFRGWLVRSACASFPDPRSDRQPGESGVLLDGAFRGAGGRLRTYPALELELRLPSAARGGHEGVLAQDALEDRRERGVVLC